ncbi:MAG: bifunctional riboflavin kinase/FAD synthetase, partial [Chloroflexota bacterium]|nr:bifunctional riboflavin kinase/FAD synthetase [Chloroflexota bacterium]
MTAAIVTIGVFDGVHLGHQMLVRQVVDRAHALGLRSMAVTFDPHPEQVLFPERRLTYLTSSAEREQLLY